MSESAGQRETRQAGELLSGRNSQFGERIASVNEILDIFSSKNLTEDKFQRVGAIYQDGIIEAYKNKDFELVFQLLHTPGFTATFPAFVTEYSDVYKSDWNDEEVLGRMDPISVFKRTRRNITLSWEVVAANVVEAYRNMQQCSNLLKMLYPAYEGSGEGNVMSAAPLLKIKFANLIHNHAGDEIVGKVDGLTYKPHMDEGFFDPRDETESRRGVLIPQVVDFSCNITVLHTSPVGWFNKQFGVSGGHKFPSLPQTSLEVLKKQFGANTQQSVINKTNDGLVTSKKVGLSKEPLLDSKTERQELKMDTTLTSFNP